MWQFHKITLRATAQLRAETKIMKYSTKDGAKTINCVKVHKKQTIILEYLSIA